MNDHRTNVAIDQETRGTPEISTTLLAVVVLMIAIITIVIVVIVIVVSVKETITEEDVTMATTTTTTTIQVLPSHEIEICIIATLHPIINPILVAPR